MTTISIDFDFSIVFCNVKLGDIAKAINESSKDFGVKLRFSGDFLNRTADLTFTSIDDVDFSYGIMMELLNNVRNAFSDAHCACPVVRVSSF